jgi:tRNA pseudouridine55 synthase
MSCAGILNIYKPAGLTSRVALDRVKRIVVPARAGHAGTLDPLATGVLVVCVGQATRLIQYVQQMPKTYRATFLLGCESDTHDIESEIRPVIGGPEPNRQAVDRALQQFLGDISQCPPAHSAIKLEGRRAYQLARRGVAVDLPARTVTVHSLSVKRYAYPELDLHIQCGSGTYIRSLGRDLGQALGTGAVMAKLERTAVGSFTTADALLLDSLTPERLRQQLRPTSAAVANLPRVTLTAAQLLEFRNGRPIMSAWLTSEVIPPTACEDFAAFDTAGNLAAILYQKTPGELWPRFNFNESPAR